MIVQIDRDPVFLLTVKRTITGFAEAAHWALWLIWLITITASTVKDPRQGLSFAMLDAALGKPAERQDLSSASCAALSMSQ